MEKEFFGLSSKNGAWCTIKDDASNKPKDSVRSSGMQWSFPNKVSALPQFLSFKTNQEERSRKTVLDPLASSAYMTMSTKDAFESNHKSFLGVTQKNLSIAKYAAGNKHGMTVYPHQCSDAQACLQETRIFSVSNQSNQVSPVLQSNIATTGLNMVNSVIKPQPLGSNSSGTTLSVLPSKGSIVGSTDLRNCSKSSGMATQLTIFYAGSVCVYDDISPEKAKAIMLMAGNGSTPTQKMTVSTANKLQPAIPIPSKDDGFIISQSYPASPRPSPLALTSHANSQPGRGSSNNNELALIKPVGPSTAPTNHLESPIIVAPAAKKIAQPVCLPQARKASLTRFLEKRKERMMSTSPYFYMSKKSSECSSSGSDSVSFSWNFSGSCPLTN